MTEEQQDLLGAYSAVVEALEREIAAQKAQLLADPRAAENTGDSQTGSQASPPAGPPNDQCSGAIAIPSAGPFPYVTDRVDSFFATKAGDPPAPSCQSDVAYSVWYTFTPSATSVYSIATCVSATDEEFPLTDSVMAIYTSANGCSGPFTQVPGACDDNSCSLGDFQAFVNSTLNAGTTYYIVVWKVGQLQPNAQASQVRLQVTRPTAPSNDGLAGAIALPLQRPTTGFMNTVTRNDYQLANTGCQTGVDQLPSTANGPEVLYSFTAPTAGTYSFKVSAEDFDAVLFVASSLPAAPAPPATVSTCLGVANRNSEQFLQREEVPCLSLAANQKVFVVVDSFSSTSGGNFTVQVDACTPETESNNTPATAGPLSCNLEGSINSSTDVDFFSLGSPAAGSRVFALVDGSSTLDSRFIHLRVTTATNTLEWDEANNAVPFGTLSANVAGTPLTGAASYLKLNGRDGLTAEPYRLYAVVQPPSSSATTEAEPNNAIADANGAANNYFYGSLTGPGPSSDTDYYKTSAAAGDLIMVNLDGDPLRDRTSLNAAVALLDSAGNVLISVDDDSSFANNSTGGDLNATNPFSPGEALTYRVMTAGTYYVRVKAGALASPSNLAGDYLLSIAKNCAIGGGIPAPVCAISCPGNVTVSNAAGQCGATVTYAAPTTTGPCGTVTCSPASGSTFAIGTTTVTCSTTAGQSCSFTVTVNDTQAPTVSCPANITRPATTGSCTAVVTYTTPTASDNCANPTVTCSPASGSTFALGTTTVTCTARDAANNTGSCSFTVTVTDAQMPTISCPANVTAPATSQSGAAVTYTAPTASDNCAAPTVTCSPASGSTFPVGATTVTCTARDAANNTSSCSFTVTVTPQAPVGGDSVGIVVDASNAWFLRNANTPGAADMAFTFGGSSSLVAISGDWDGNGTSTPGLYEPSTGTFYLRNSNAGGNADVVFTFGAAGAGIVPLVGDWNNDGTDTIGIYNPATAAFFLRNTNAGGNADLTFSFGAAGAGFLPLSGDWNGDGTDTIGLYAPATGAFFLRNTNANGGADATFTFGGAGAGLIPLTGDWNHDATDSIGLYAPSTGTFFLRNANSAGGADVAFSFGPTNARPLVGNWDGQ